MTNIIELKPNLQDFSTVDTNLLKIMAELKLKTKSAAFYFYVLDLLFNLQEDEIKDCITDTHFLSELGANTGHDRGIDAIYFAQSDIKNKIHIFNFKYADSFEKTKSNFPAGEIDKISGFLGALMSKDVKYQSSVNPILREKMNEIWEIFEDETPDFVFHICTNQYYGFEKQEKDRFEREMKKYNVSVRYHLMPELVKLLTKKGQITVNAKIKAIDKQFFERSDGDVRALIVNIDVVDLLRICLNDEELRNKPSSSDNKSMIHCELLDDVYEDNVRVYLKQRSRINRNIKSTALSEESHRIFYFNNGITITCEHFEYPGGNMRSPIIELTGLQVVNGSQTIHALFEAYQADQSKFNNMTILCRIYETRNKTLSTHIAEYTNSQNPVNTRDIRSIDFIQIKLEKEFAAIGYYYERKKNQYSGKTRDKRLDAEKVGQVLMAFYHKMPSEAKDKKRLIFAEKYDDIFTDSITADKILLPVLLFRKIEEEKSSLRSKVFAGNKINITLFEEQGPIIYASYWILYVLNEIANRLNIDLLNKNYENIAQYYPQACKIIIDIWKEDLKKYKGQSKIFAFAAFFKKSKPMDYLNRIFDSDQITKYIKTS